jgi:histidine ammonia-lyase
LKGKGMSERFVLRPGTLTLADLRRFYTAERAVEIAPSDMVPVAEARAVVDDVLAGDAAVYGVTTGFGKLAATRIRAEDVAELQRRLVLSHSVGTGPLLTDAVVRLVMLLKAGSLAIGRSGVRPVIIEALLALLNADVIPCIPSKGSVGASGDLAPLAHMSGVLLGEGEVRIQGVRRPAVDGLEAAGLAPLALAAKEGLALLNGTQVSTALALAGLFAIEDAFAAALTAGALSIDAALGTDTPFDARIGAVRGQPGQIAVAAALRALIADSEIRASHVDCERVQDPYSLRCQPQVMGACLDVMRAAAAMLEREANGVSDNPLVFAETGEILSGGNFHAEPVAFAADMLALAAAEIGGLSERRTALLIDPGFSALPAFLMKDPGLNSGFMMPQVTAAALVAENRLLASPASVDSIPTSANQEDHVSMATHAARRLGDMAENAATIVAIELLAAAQGIDLRRPLTTSQTLERAMAMIRDVAAFLDQDRALAPDMAAVTALVRDGLFHTFLPAGLLPSRG